MNSRLIIVLAALVSVRTGFSRPNRADSAEQELDRVLQAENSQKGVSGTATVVIDDLAYLRRVSIDLIGRIPTGSEITTYLSGPRKTRRTKVVDRLMKDSRFAGRWTVFFGDMLRLRSNAEGGAALTAYVHRAVERGMPYDEMVRGLIATNGRAGQTPEVGFVLGDNADPMALAGVTSQVFLGVRIACAQCHNHPFDKWTRKDFYGFAAYFGKTRRVQRRFKNRIFATYTTDIQQTSVLWPPQGVGDDSERKAMPARFPLTLDKSDGPRRHIARLQKLRQKQTDLAKAATRKNKKTSPSIDDLLNDAAKKADSRTSQVDTTLGKVAAEARRDVRNVAAKRGGYRNSELRKALAALVTNPRNRYFSRAFVNRVWKELIGRGFVEPIDDFSDRNRPSHPQTLDYIADEFVASGYDLRQLIRLIVGSNIYQRAHADGRNGKARLALESTFRAAPMRRMISESLYDSLVIAGHLDHVKHVAGKNLKTVWRQSRIMKRPTQLNSSTVKPMKLAVTGKTKTKTKKMKARTANPSKGYSVENAIEIDFEAILKNRGNKGVMIDRMKVKSKEELEAERMQAETQRQRAEYIDRFVKSTFDDNPRFGSSLKMASPAAPEHFLRVFGQPGRSELGDFRDGSASMRQALILLNGRLTHEASRVGELEPVYPLLLGKNADLTSAIRLAFREILTREPSTEETATAREVIAAAGSPLKGMADFRWVLLNSNEFRFLP